MTFLNPKLGHELIILIQKPFVFHQKRNFWSHCPNAQKLWGFKSQTSFQLLNVLFSSQSEYQALHLLNIGQMFLVYSHFVYYFEVLKTLWCVWILDLKNWILLDSEV